MDSRNRRWPLVWLALVTIALVSVASLGYVELTERDRRIQELEQRIGSTQRLVTSMDDRIDNLRIPPDLTSSISLLQGDVSDLQGTVDDMEGDLSSMWIEIGTVESELFALTDCVNEYMDTIGSWSSNVSSFYTYYYC